MIQASVIFIIIKIIHGYGVVATKKIRNLNGVHIFFIQGICILFFNSLVLPYIISQPNYKPISYPIFLQSLLFTATPIALGTICWIQALILSKNFGMITTLSFTSIIIGYVVSIFRYG